jgi:drug/metabolite transporter (DMT)-like permease
MTAMVQDALAWFAQTWPYSLAMTFVAGYPLVTVLLGAALLREEPLNLRMIAGALLVVAAIAYLVAGS